MNNEHDYTTHAYKWLCYTKHENFYDDVYEFLCPPSDPSLNGVRIRQSSIGWSSGGPINVLESIDEQKNMLRMPTRM